MYSDLDTESIENLCAFQNGSLLILNFRITMAKNKEEVAFCSHDSHERPEMFCFDLDGDIFAYQPLQRIFKRSQALNLCKFINIFALANHYFECILEESIKFYVNLLILQRCIFNNSI